MNTFFKADQRAAVIADHMKLVRFIKALGCDHLKINCSAEPRRQHGRIYREQAKTFNELSKRISAEGIKFGIHALVLTVRDGPDVARIMELTGPSVVS
jgi:sugar phosphate isomerase/epimerase